MSNALHYEIVVKVNDRELLIAKARYQAVKSGTHNEESVADEIQDEAQALRYLITDKVWTCR